MWSYRASSLCFFFSSRRRHTRCSRDWSSDVCSSDLAFAATNEAGGVNGRKLRLVALDDGYEPERTRSVMKELAGSPRGFGLIGNLGTPTPQAAGAVRPG